MSAVASAATANFGIESYMQSQLNLIGQVGNNPSPQQMLQLAQAYQFFSAMWTQGSFTANGVNVNFDDIKDQNVVKGLPALHDKITALFSSYNNVCLPSPGGDSLQLKEANGQPATLLDLVTGAGGPFTAEVRTCGNQSSVDWYDGDLDDATGHNNGWAGVPDQTGSLDPSKMPPGFSCNFDTYCANCGIQNHTHFTLTIDPKAIAAGAETADGVTAGESCLQWLQQHCNAQSDNTPAKEDPSMTQSQYDLNQFDASFEAVMNA